MTTANPAAGSIANRVQTWLLAIEWLSLLTGVLLCLPSEDQYPGHYLALFLLGASWAARGARIRRLTRSTPLDVPLLLFLLSLLIGFFAAPDPATAFTRLVLFLAAFSFYYSLVNSPLGSLDLVMNLTILALALSALFLIGQYDWSVGPARFPLQQPIGMQLNRVIPALNVDLPAWTAMRNMLASLLSLFLPILILQLVRSLQWLKGAPGPARSRRPGYLKLALLVLSGLLILLDLLLTESRAPWLAYAAILAIAAWWWLSRRIGERVGLSPRAILFTGFVLAGLLLLASINILGRNASLISLLPGEDTLTGRLEIYAQSRYLAEDTPFTGGGLGAFTPLYSFYIRVLPVDAFLSEATGVNLFQHVHVEQGWLGLISLLFIVLIPPYVALSHLDNPDATDRGLLAVGLIGAATLLLYGFLHALLGESRAIPFLLLPAGLIFAGLGPSRAGLTRAPDLRFNRRQVAILILSILPLLAYLLLAPAPRAAWYANLGALRMARVQLAGWPTGTWEDGSTLPALEPAQALLQKALALNPHNRTSNHRMGLVALLQRDFNAAVHFLENAYRANPGHRGVTKSLGYALIWKGEVERGSELLEKIPEAAHELDNYTWWWNSHDRPDLAERASEASMLLRPAP